MFKKKVGVFVLMSVVGLFIINGAFASMRYECVFVVNGTTKFHSVSADSKSEAESLANQWIRSNYPNGYLKHC